MKPATSTKLALFCCYFYSTAGAVMQVFFYKTVTFWGCVDEVTEFALCFWLFCTTEMGRGRAQRARRGISLRGGTGASSASPQRAWLAGRYRGERSEPAEGLACGEVPGASAASPQGDGLAGRGRAAPRAPYGARRPPQGGARRFCGGGRRGLLRRAGNQKADPLQMRESAKNHSWCRIMRAHL